MKSIYVFPLDQSISTATMQTTEFVDPLPTETKEDVCWHNLRIADDNHDLKLFIFAAMGWFKLHPTGSYQDLERELRTKSFQTHLIASHKRLANTKLYLPNLETKTEAKYECIYSCRPSPYALRELLTHWPTHEENFVRLKEAGVIVSDNSSTDSSSEIKKLSSSEMSVSELISNNLKKIVVQKITTEEFMAELEEKCMAAFQRNPEPKLIAMGPDGSPILGFFIDDKLLSDIGITIGFVGDEKVTNLVDLKRIR